METDNFAAWLRDFEGLKTNMVTTMDRCQGMLAEIYHRQNLPMGLWWMASCLVARGLTLTKNSGNPDKWSVFKTQTAGAFAWAAAIATRGEIKLEDILWEHFPGVCPYCGQKPCTGHPGKKGNRLDVSVLARLVENKPKSVTGWQIMFDEIYPKNTLPSSVAHLAQETAEVLEAVRIIYSVPALANDFSGLYLELADVVAHILGIATCMRIQLSELVCEIYGNGCPICGKPACECGHAFLLESVGTKVL